MRLTRDKIDYIKNVVDVANSLGMEKVILQYDGEKGVIRAVNDGMTACMFHENDFELPFTALGIPLTNLFLSRLNLVQGSEGFTMNVDINDKELDVTRLIMKSKHTKAEYKAANHESIKAPKRINDNMKYRFKIEKPDFQTISQASNAMPQSGEQVDHTITILGNVDSVVFELQDQRRDIFSHTVETEVKDITGLGDPVGFAHRYHLNTILNVIKRSEDFVFDVGEQGILKTNISGITTFVLPRV